MTLPLNSDIVINAIRAEVVSDFENVRFVANLVVTLLVTPLAMVIWYQLKNAQGTATRVAAELAAHRLHASETYATKTSVDAAVGRLESSVERAFDRFDRKLDDISLKIDRKADKNDASYHA